MTFNGNMAIDVFVYRSVFGVWRSVVDAIAQSAASRLAAAEEYRRLIGQASRSLHNAKDIRIKKVRELHTVDTFSYEILKT